MNTRRTFLRSITGAVTAGWLARYHALAAPGKGRTRIRDVKTMVMQGPERNYTFVRVDSDAGMYGIGEGYGSPGVGIKEQVHALKPLLIGKDPLEIDVLYTGLGRHTDGSAHSFLRGASGIEMALWDLAGKTLGVPASILLGGKFRDKVRMYDHMAPRNMLEPASCREWTERVKAGPSGFKCHKFSPQRTKQGEDHARDRSNRVLTTTELAHIRRGYENCREAIGWGHDVMVHCHWEYDLRASIQLAQAVEPIKPFWLEDPLPVDYSDSWKRLVAASNVPVCMGENLARRAEFKDFIINQACDILHPDLRNSGGLLETKRIADLADVFGLPMANHNTGSMVNTIATVVWAASIRDYLLCETIIGKGDWMDKVVLWDGPVIQDGYIQVPDKPGLGIELNPDVVRAHLATGETWW
ncbi:MAG: mandelate racemase/muconate lactonizing enzyme family protein [Acidobacteria bacterium]|nr:mandelate racemase/muconate lactonizing enzyme family protein [Acidobacteriota bacterium]MBI3281871.1 mandelate racemase/muconate lactonizing enzyme family protein [Acidobacteriota bacterium]